MFIVSRYVVTQVISHLLISAIIPADHQRCDSKSDETNNKQESIQEWLPQDFAYSGNSWSFYIYSIYTVPPALRISRIHMGRREFAQSFSGLAATAGGSFKGTSPWSLRPIHASTRQPALALGCWLGVIGAIWRCQGAVERNLHFEPHLVLEIQTAEGSETWTGACQR